MARRLIIFFFNDTATTEIYTLSLHDALPILGIGLRQGNPKMGGTRGIRVSGNMHLIREFERTRRNSIYHFRSGSTARISGDRKSTRLNSSHSQISYAVFCLKKKTLKQTIDSV